MTEEKNKVSFFAKIWNSHFLCGSLALLFTLAACVYSMFDREKLPSITIPVKDQKAEKTIKAQIGFESVNLAETEKRKTENLKKLPLFYRISKDAEEQTRKYMDEFFSEAERRDKLEEQKMPYKKSGIAGDLISVLSPETVAVFAELNRNRSRFLPFQNHILAAVRNGLLPADTKVIPPSKNVRIIDADDRKHEPVGFGTIRNVSQEADHLTASMLASYRDRKKIAPELHNALVKILSKGQMQFDQEEMKKEIQLIMEQPITETVKQNSILIRKGDIVGEYDIRRMEEYKIAIQKAWIKTKRFEKIQLERFVQNLAITLLILLFCGIYLYHIHREVLENNSTIRMLTFTTVSAVFFNLLVSHAYQMLDEQYSIQGNLNLLYIVLPLGFAPLVLSVTYGMRCALFTGLFITVIAALSTTDPFHVVLLGLMISGVASFSVRRVRNYRNFFISAFLTVSITTLIVSSLVLWRDFTPLREIPIWAFTLPFACGLVTAGAALIMVFILEAVFDVTTDMSLLLYSDYSHPLLRRLQLEAPGTYFHSLSVASLAEAAAQQIGANPIVTRTCALFHDVGKLSKPTYFTENNVGADLHKDLPPETSARIILDHVKDGMALARKYKLRKLIRDAIQQHHGTDLVRFFYEKAKESGNPVDEKNFRYDGPPPSQKEIAIVMLADACEAASRSLQQPTAAKIEELVSNILEKRLRGGQLSDADLTFRELRIIKKSFVNTLSPMLHARVAYPTKTVHNENDLFMDKAK